MLEIVLNTFQERGIDSLTLCFQILDVLADQG